MDGPHPGNRDSSAPFFTPQPGDVLAGKYRVESTLGAGGMGVVVLVEHIELGQRMAIKLMTPGVSHDTQAIARFLREARAAAGIQSEHVVRIFDVGTLETGAPFMVMELLRGEDLGQLLENAGTLPIHEAVDYVLQACHAIAEAHAMGIVHRDLKPSNLFLTRRSDGSALVKVLDFGISKVMSTERDGQVSANLTATSAVMGSPLYMSPEQVRNAKQVDARADIWSLGVILHELITGGPAFQADTLPGICAAIIADDPPLLRSQREDAPYELEVVITRCLEKSVTKRFQTIRELMMALRAFGSAGVRIGTDSKPIASTIPSSGSTGRRPLPPVLEAAATADSIPASAQRSRENAPGSGPQSPRARRPPSPFERSAAPVATSPEIVFPKTATGSRRMVVLASSAGVLLALGFTVFSITHREPPPPPPAISKTVETLPARKSFTLFVDSTPSGASVVEGDATLGNTPMQISVDNEAARREPRKLSVRRDGFQAYSILQGPSEDNVRVNAALVALATEPPVIAKTTPPPPQQPRAQKPLPKSTLAEPTPQPTAPAAPPPATTPNPGDIRLQR